MGSNRHDEKSDENVANGSSDMTVLDPELRQLVRERASGSNSTTDSTTATNQQQHNSSSKSTTTTTTDESIKAQYKRDHNPNKSSNNTSNASNNIDDSTSTTTTKKSTTSNNNSNNSARPARRLESIKAKYRQESRHAQRQQQQKEERAIPGKADNHTGNNNTTTTATTTALGNDIDQSTKSQYKSNKKSSSNRVGAVAVMGTKVHQENDNENVDNINDNKKSTDDKKIKKSHKKKKQKKNNSNNNNAKVGAIAVTGITATETNKNAPEDETPSDPADQDDHDGQEPSTAPPPPSLQPTAAHNHLSAPGAWGVQPFGGRDDSSDSSSTDEIVFSPDDEETGRATMDPTNITTASSREQQQQHEPYLLNNNNIDNTANLIQAELVIEGEDESNNDIVDAKIVTSTSDRRRRLVLIIVVVAVVAAIVIAVTVSVVNNGGGGGTVPNSNDADDNNNTEVVPRFPTPNPSMSLAPSQAPSFSRPPTNLPTMSPTQLEWQNVIGAQEATQLDGWTMDENFAFRNGGNFGKKVNLVDIRGTPLAEETNRTTMLAIGLGSVQSHQTVAGLTANRPGSAIYLCGENDPGTETRDYCEFKLRLGGNYVDSAYSGDGAFYIEEKDLAGNGTLYDLTALASYNVTHGYPASYELTWTSEGVPQNIALNHNGRTLVAMSTYALEVIELARIYPGGPFFDKSRQGFAPEISVPPFDPNNPSPFPPEPVKEQFNTFVMTDEVMIVVTDQGDTPTCTQQPCPINEGYKIYTYDMEFILFDIVEPLESEQDLSGPLSADSLAINGDATILAIASNNSSSRVLRSQVNVYHRPDNSQWVPLGLPLFGSEDGDDKFGVAVSLNDDGTMLAIGAPSDGSNGSSSGRVYIYQFSEAEEEWVLFGDLVGPTPGGEFGSSVALHPTENQILVGAPKARLNGDNTGYAYLYNTVGV